MTKAKHPPLTIEATTGKPDPTPPKIKLNSIGDVRREMATIYRAARTGKVDISDAGRLAYVLTGIGKLIEVELIEQRLAQLERKLLK
ncbi:MAG: hypothetical protein NTV11_05450 [Rhodocyclales bacterium]|nr:hypothetical protein [Rhodocyclales bacterium]